MEKNNQLHRAVSAALSVLLLAGAIVSPAHATVSKPYESQSATITAYTDTRQSGGRDSGSTSMKKLSKAEIAQMLVDAPLDLSSDVFDAIPSCTAPFSAGKVKTTALRAAVDRLNLMRRLAGLPDVTLDMDLCENAQYGAVIQGVIGSLDHRPAQPAGMSDEFYRQAYAASSSSNLAAGVTLTYAVDGWMDDSDTYNVDRLGHRRWQLNPTLGKVGFGYIEPSDSRYHSYAAEKVFDTSGSRCDYDFISWPASGNFPSDLISLNTAWSVTLAPDKYQTPRQSDLTVTVTRESDGKVWTLRGDDYAPTYYENYFCVDTAGYGVANCIIFRPDGTEETQNYNGIYTVRIDGLKTIDGRSVKDFTYSVDFFDSTAIEPEQPAEQPVAPQKPDQAPLFRDVPANAYYRDAVQWAVEQKITGGTSADTFSPETPCTRGQIVTFLWRAAGSPKPQSATNPFRDVDANAYYYNAILWAVEQGITSGTGAGTFSPDATVTRGQTVTFLYRTAGSPAASGSSFDDVPAGAYFADAAAWAAQTGITSGTGNGKFSPQANCSRAQIVTFLFRQYGK